jgi:hypothetical protein
MTIVAGESEQEIDIEAWARLYVRTVVAQDAAEKNALCESLKTDPGEFLEREVKESDEEE